MFRFPLFTALLAAWTISALAADFLVSDWEDMQTTHPLGGSWYYVTDQSSQGQSRILTGDTVFSPTAIDSTSFAEGFGGSTRALKMGFVFGAVKPVCGDSCVYDPEVSIEAGLSSDTAVSMDFTGAAGISFQAKADRAMKVRFIVGTPEILDYAFYGSDLDIGTEWKLYTVPLDSGAAFSQPAWKTESKPFNKAAVTTLSFLASKENNPFDTGTFFVDDIKVLGWEKPTALRFRPEMKRSVRAPASILSSGGVLRIAIPAAFAGTDGVAEAYSPAGVLIARKAFSKDETRLELHAGPEGLRGPVAVKFRRKAGGQVTSR